MKDPAARECYKEAFNQRNAAAQEANDEVTLDTKVLWANLKDEVCGMVGDKPVRNDAGDMSTTNETKQMAW